MVLQWRLSDSKSPQVFMTLLSILADLNNAVVWMVSTRSLIFKSSSRFINSLVIVQRVHITICIHITFMLHSFLKVFLKFDREVEVFIFLITFF